MFLVDTPRPAAGQFATQWFWLTHASERIALRVSYQANDANRLSPILFGPPHEIVERAGVEFDAPHKPNFVTASSSDTPSER